MQKKPKVLFLAAHSPTESQMAAGFLRALGGEAFDVVCAGIEPGETNSLAAEVMREVGVDISEQKEVSVADALKQFFAHVVIFYDAAKDHSPIFPFTLNLQRWSLVDPATSQGALDEKKAELRHVRDEIKKRIEKFLDQTQQGHREEHVPMAA